MTTRDSWCPQSNHATHVACTASATGIDAGAIGHASDMHALLSDCPSTDTGAVFCTYPGELEADLVYAKDSWDPSGGDDDGAELLNASVGTSTDKNGWPCVWEDNYGPTAVILDNAVRGDTAAGGRFITFWANGNERGHPRCGQSYHSTAPPACAKNRIQVGATNKDADTMTSFSGWGRATTAVSSGSSLHRVAPRVAGSSRAWQRATRPTMADTAAHRWRRPPSPVSWHN